MAKYFSSSWGIAMLLLFSLCLLCLLSSSLARHSRRRELFNPIRASCHKMDFCRSVADDDLCDLECSSADCGFDGRDCLAISARDAKMMMVLHISPPDFMFVSHRFLSELSFITGSRVEMARDSKDILMWRWTHELGPQERLFPEYERLSTHSRISSIQVMLSIKLLDCSNECIERIETSTGAWYELVRNEDLSHFMADLLYGSVDETHSSYSTLLLSIGIAGCVILLLSMACFIHGKKSRWREESTPEDTSPLDPLPLHPLRVVGREVNRLEKGQDSPLHSLISSYNQSIEEDIRALINCGESINTVDREGRSVLHTSIVHGRSPSFFRWLISMGADPSTVDDKGQTLLHVAVSFRNLHIISILLEFPTVFRMMDHCDYRNMSTLKLAMSEESTEISRLLIDCGASVDLSGMKGFDPLLCHRSPLHLAIMNNHTKQVELLLERGADVNIVDDAGLSPLHYAVMYCGIRVVEQLLNEEKCDVLKRDKQKNTAEDLARRKGKIEIVNLLKEASEKSGENRRPYAKNLHLHKSKELLNMRGEDTVESSHHTHVQPNVPMAPSEHSSAADEGVYSTLNSDYQYPHLVHSNKTLYYL